VKIDKRIYNVKIEMNNIDKIELDGRVFLAARNKEVVARQGRMD
jgi:hypothetical protein